MNLIQELAAELFDGDEDAFRTYARPLIGDGWSSDVEVPPVIADFIRTQRTIQRAREATAVQRLAAVIELCQRVDANGGGGYVRTDAILALAMPA